MLDDVELGKVCQVNKYANKLCQNQQLWMNRFGKYFKIEEVQRKTMIGNLFIKTLLDKSILFKAIFILMIAL